MPLLLLLLLLLLVTLLLLPLLLLLLPTLPKTAMTTQPLTIVTRELDLGAAHQRQRRERERAAVSTAIMKMKSEEMKGSMEEERGAGGAVVVARLKAWSRFEV